MAIKIDTANKVGEGAVLRVNDMLTLKYGILCENQTGDTGNRQIGGM